LLVTSSKIERFVFIIAGQISRRQIRLGAVSPPSALAFASEFVAAAPPC
jgi:hypothetical protein